MYHRHTTKYLRRNSNAISILRPKSDDHIEEAEKFLADEKKRMAELNAIIPSENSPLTVLATVTSFFPDMSGFNLKNITIEENIVRLDGDTDNVQPLDTFKNSLLESKQFDAVDLNTNIVGTSSVRFSMVIKLKSTTGVKK